jgi:hypothetical protein
VELPAPYLRLVPELGAAEFPQESHATCASCAMAPRGGEREGQPTFTAPARCCTYHPRLVNFLAGRALRRGGLGAERVRARIAGGEGVRARGIDSTRAWDERWDKRGAEGFGRDPELTCPYWADDAELKCTVYQDRNSVCRTWHCKLRHGARGYEAWSKAATILSRLERELSAWCVETLPGRPEDDASAADFEQWFVACADAVDALPEDVADRLRTPRIGQWVGELNEAIAAREAPMPEVLQPRVHDWIRRTDVTLLTSWSSLDRVETPPWIFELLSRFDGVRPWREAVALTAAAIGAPVEESLVRLLWERGLVGPPVPFDGPVTRFSILPGE